MPKITYINASTTVNDFDELGLECIATGIPFPFISWHLNDEIVLEPSHDVYKHFQLGEKGYSIDERGNVVLNHSLIPPMMHGVVTLANNNEINLKIIYSKYAKKKTGKYVCRAATFAGRDEKFVEVEVNCKNLFRVEMQVFDNEIFYSQFVET